MAKYWGFHTVNCQEGYIKRKSTAFPGGLLSSGDILIFWNQSTVKVHVVICWLQDWISSRTVIISFHCLGYQNTPQIPTCICCHKKQSLSKPQEIQWVPRRPVLLDRRVEEWMQWRNKSIRVQGRGKGGSLRLPEQNQNQLEHSKMYL